MNTKSVLAHLLLALGGLTLAYLVWTDDEAAPAPGEVTIFACDPDELCRIELELGEREVTVELNRDGEQLLAWVTVTRTPEEGEATTQVFVGSEELETYLAQLAPLRATRSLGALSEEQLADVGLAEPEGALRLRCGERSASFQIGASAYGNGDRYVRGESGPAYLVARDRVQPLESAEHQLMQRALHTFEWSEVEGLTVSGWGAERTLLQRNRLDPQRAEWVDVSAPDRRNELFGNWLQRYPRLRVQEYLGPDQRPGADLDDVSEAPEPLLRLAIRGEDGPLGEVEMQRVGRDAYYVRTETTRSWVRIPTSVASGFIEDARTVLGQQPEPDAPEEAPAPEAPASEAPASEAPASEAPAPEVPEEGPSAEAPTPAPVRPAPDRPEPPSPTAPTSPPVE